MQLHDLVKQLDALLQPQNYRDYAPNGLQVQGRKEIRRIVTGVTACLDLIEQAKQREADAILVHHGWFWKREDPRIIGIRHRRIAELINADMSLIAYHLPLDDHPELGNNALLGKMLNIEADARFGDDDLAWIGSAPATMTCDQLTDVLRRALRRPPLVVGPRDKTLRRIAWCSGAAQDMLEAAVDAGADCFISGEISERTTHIAREAGITYFACGHHATERAGIEALGRWIAERNDDVQVEFIDIDNPV